MDLDLALEIFGFCVGVAYLWWEYHANRLVWVASIIMPAVSLWIYLSKGLYADFAINIYYFLIAIYGFWKWSAKSPKAPKSASGEHRDLPITRLTLRRGLTYAALTALLWVALWWVLARFTNSNVPVSDAFTTALSIVAMLMLARKIAEQWLAWLVVDAVTVGLYLYKEIYFYAALYAIYTLVAGFGYRKWLRLMRQQG